MTSINPAVVTPVNHFDGVTLLITHYNRSRSLQRLLATFTQLGCSFSDIVVSDDGSRPEHQPVLRQLSVQYGFHLITTPKNQGLGHNLNKGQDAVQTAYTLYIQEDFVPQPLFVQRLRESLALMHQNQSLDIVRYYAYVPYPYVRPYADGFSEMLFSPWALNYYKIYCYSDHPHLRRSSFFAKFGRYTEGMPGDKTEYRMCILFLQKKGKGLFYTDFKALFAQENDSAEPSTMQRAKWTGSKNPLIAVVRYVYRQIKYNYDIRYLS
ncbi:MAG: glycosyltransferase [Bacteroidetes bacterium]|nr:glycosyltransferase [Fibrella sp.]